MLVKKRFLVIQLEEEKKFIINQLQNGLILYKVDYQGYYFKKLEKIENPLVIIHFYFKENSHIEEYYLSKGANLLYKRHSSKGIWYYFLTEKYDIEKLDDDITTLLQDVAGRLDIFWLVVIIAIGAFSLFMSIVKGNWIFLIPLIVSLIFIIYLFLVKKNIKNTIKKLLEN